jgi:transposase
MEWGTRNKQIASLNFDLIAWQKYYNRNQLEYIRRRLRAIKMYSEGKSRIEILQTLSISPKTLSGYLDMYILGGLDGLTSPIVKSRLQALSKQQQEKLRVMVLHESPETYSKKEQFGL